MARTEHAKQKRNVGRTRTSSRHRQEEKRLLRNGDYDVIPTSVSSKAFRTYVTNPGSLA